MRHYELPLGPKGFKGGPKGGIKTGLSEAFARLYEGLKGLKVTGYR